MNYMDQKSNVEEHSVENISVEAIMEVIKQKIVADRENDVLENAESRKDYITSENAINIFDRTVDAADIMRKVIDEVGKNHAKQLELETDKSAVGNFEQLSVQLEEIRDAVIRTELESREYKEPGRIIGVNPKRPALLNKLLLLYKRFVRKSTRYLAVDQTMFNDKTGYCISSLGESLTSVVDALRLMQGIVRHQEDKQREMWLEIVRLNTQIAKYETTLKQLVQRLDDMEKTEN